jgi:hypothetical protein
LKTDSLDGDREVANGENGRSRDAAASGGCRPGFVGSGRYGGLVLLVGSWLREREARLRPEAAKGVQAAGIKDGHAHRFRDTFAVDLLEKGVGLESVAALLGNTPAIAAKHYSPWIHSRRVILEESVRRTWN